METYSYELSMNRIKFIKLIEQHFPRYVLRDIEELSPFARNYFKSHYPNFDPSLVHRDFDGNGFEDVAFLLRESKNKDYINIFVIFLQSSHEKFKMKYCLNIGANPGDLYIIPLESGSQIESFDEPRKKIKLKNSSVELVYFEKSSVVYYWDGRTKKFKSIWTSD